MFFFCRSEVAELPDHVNLSLDQPPSNLEPRSGKDAVGAWWQQSASSSSQAPGVVGATTDELDELLQQSSQTLDFWTQRRRSRELQQQRGGGNTLEQLVREQGGRPPSSFQPAAGPGPYRTDIFPGAHRDSESGTSEEKNRAPKSNIRLEGWCCFVIPPHLCFQSFVPGAFLSPPLLFPCCNWLNAQC